MTNILIIIRKLVSGGYLKPGGLVMKPGRPLPCPVCQEAPR